MRILQPGGCCHGVPRKTHLDAFRFGGVENAVNSSQVAQNLPIFPIGYRHLAYVQAGTVPDHPPLKIDRTCRNM
jgi:hypothetical protein